MLKIVEDYYSTSCLFMALYNLSRNAYFGQGFLLNRNYIQNQDLKQKIEQPPLDIKIIIFSKIWEKLEPKKGFIVNRGKLLFDFSLHYLFSQYGKLKSQMKNEVPQAYVAWTRSKILGRFYNLLTDL